MGSRIFIKSLFMKLIKISATPLYWTATLQSRFQTHKKIPILLYHKITDVSEGIDAFWNVSPGLFSEQIEFLLENGFQVISLQSFYDTSQFKNNLPRSTVILTFDDGYANFYTNVYPVLCKYRLPATVFLTVQYTGTNSFYEWDRPLIAKKKEFEKEFRPLSWNQINEMKESGLITFGSHSMSHPHLGRLPDDKIVYELRESKRILEERLEQPILFFSYPGGSYAYGDVNKNTRRHLVECGYKLACTSRTGRNRISDDILSLKRIGISRHDDIPLFRAKLTGGCDWMGWAQFAFQKTFANVW